MEFRQVKYFLVLAEYRNFTRAAEVLHIAQPTLSQQIAELERDLGVKLLRRTNRLVELTSAGLAFREEAEQLYEQYFHCLHTMDSYRTGESGKLVLATLDTLEMTFLPSFFSRFRANHPDISVSHITGSFRSIQQMLHSKTVDVGINVISREECCPEIVSIPVNRDRLVLAAGEEDELSGLCSFDDPRVYDLLTRRCFLWNGWHESKQVLGFLRRRVPQFSCTWLDNMTTVLMRVQGERGCTLIPEAYLDSFRQEKPMVRVLLPEPYAALEVLMLRHRENTNPCARLFLREAEEFLNQIGRPNLFSPCQIAATPPAPPVPHSNH